MTDDADVRRRRAIYRANHRGTKEMDVLIGRYTEATVSSLDGEALSHLERFLALPDPTLQAWFFGPGTAEQSEFLALVADMKRFHGLDVGHGDER